MMKKLITIFLILCLTTSAFGQFQQKPMLGEQIDRAHQLGDPVAAWLFNEGSGNKVFDLSGNGNTGTLVADTHWVPGKFGSALDFDGTGDIVNLGSNASLDNITVGNFTIIVWAKTSVVAANHGDLVSNGVTDPGTYLMQLDDSGNIKGHLWTTGGSGIIQGNTTSLDDGIWHQFAFCVSETVISVYLDSLFDGSAAITGTKAAADVSHFIGNRSVATAAEWLGQIDHVMIWGRALSASEIALLYREPFCMFQKDDIALMAVEAPAPGGGQVIYINFGMISFIFLIMMRRKCRRK